MTEARAPAPVLIIVPTYNEAENIGALLGDILRETEPFGANALVVDDNSPDGTGQIVEDMGQENDRVHLLRREGKLGLGTAYLAGLRYAMENGYNLAVTMDADFSHSPTHLPAVIEAAMDADVVIGSRYVEGGGISNWPARRKLLSWGANLMAHIVLRVRARDCTSGFRAYRREVLEGVDLGSIRSDGYSFLIDLITVCERHGARVAESPIHFVDRRGGVSKISKTEIFKAFGTLWRLFWSR